MPHGCAVKGLSVRQTSEHIRMAHPRASLRKSGQGLADQGYAFARAAELRSCLTNDAAGQIASLRKTMLFEQAQQLSAGGLGLPRLSPVQVAFKK